VKKPTKKIVPAKKRKQRKRGTRFACPECRAGLGFDRMIQAAIENLSEAEARVPVAKAIFNLVPTPSADATRTGCDMLGKAPSNMPP